MVITNKDIDIVMKDINSFFIDNKISFSKDQTGFRLNYNDSLNLSPRLSKKSFYNIIDTIDNLLKVMDSKRMINKK